MSKEEQYKTVQEGEILKALNHEYIVKLKEIYKTKGRNLNIVMEYCDGNSQPHL